MSLSSYDHLRFLPPLVISQGELSVVVDKVGEVLAKPITTSRAGGNE